MSMRIKDWKAYRSDLRSLSSVRGVNFMEAMRKLKLLQNGQGEVEMLTTNEAEILRLVARDLKGSPAAQPELEAAAQRNLEARASGKGSAGVR